MSLENALITLNKELAKAETTAQALRASIKALGGMVGQAAGKPARRRKGGGWPKGKPRGPKSPSGTVEASVDNPAAEPEPVASPIAQARAKRAAPKPGASLAAAAS